MESSTTGDEALPPKLGIILRNIEELKEAALESNKTIMQQYGISSDITSRRSDQSALLNKFKEMMALAQDKASKAIYEVETKLGQLEDLPGVSAESNLNRLMGCTLLGRKPSYKLRDSITGIPIPQLITDNDANTTPPQGLGGPLVVLQPTLRNVWVVQHAYAKLLNHKENLIQQYHRDVDCEAGVSRKLSREYYEELSLVILPSKNKLGNLLDVKRSSFNHATHYVTIVLAFREPDGGLRYVEAVTGDAVSIEKNDESQLYLVLPAAEACIKNLYEAYRGLRKATSEQRRATRDKEFAARLPVDEVGELQKQLSSAAVTRPDGSDAVGSRKRRRTEDDDA